MQLTRFRGNEVHEERWGAVYRKLPVEVTCAPIADFKTQPEQYRLIWEKTK
jgi:hypothetical protein